MTDRTPLPPIVLEERLLAVLRAPASAHLPAAALALAGHGMHCIEITLTTPGALEVIATLAHSTDPVVAVGAGTVLSEGDVDDAVAAGAGYLVAPNLDERVICAALRRGVPVVPGAATPTEITTAWRLGASAVKVFPAPCLGGPGFLRSVREPLPHIPLIPTGGVGIDQARDYLAAGAVAVGVGSPLCGDALVTGDIDAIVERAGRLRSLTAA